eukprot:326356_1
MSYNIKLRPRNRFVCCSNQTLKGRHGIRMIKLECIECESIWHDRCLLNKYGQSKRGLTEKLWRCPDCVAYKDSTRKHMKKYKKKQKLKKKETLKYKYSDSDEYKPSTDYSSCDIVSISSTDSEEVSKQKDAKNKNITGKLKRRKQKEKSIKNRLKNINPKYKFKFSKSMLEVSDSATDEDFDCGMFYPEKMPKSDKALENLRSKKAKKHKIGYFKPKKNTEYRSFECQSLIDLILGIAARPKRFKYNPRFGWSGTDVAQLGAMYLYELRKKDPHKHINIPMRNPASIKAKFKSWDDPMNKESKDKDWISKYEAAKNKLIDLSKKAASNVNEELVNFGETYAQTRLTNARNQLKKLQDEKKSAADVGNMFKDALSGVAGLITELRSDSKAEQKKQENIEKMDSCNTNNSTNVTNSQRNMRDNYKENNYQENNYQNNNYQENNYQENNYDANASNPYIDNKLMNTANEFSPSNNEQFLAQYKVKPNRAATVDYRANYLCIQKLDKVCGFLTKMNNLPASPFDEENQTLKSQVFICERAFVHGQKGMVIARKYEALKQIQGLSDINILNQLTTLAQLL